MHGRDFPVNVDRRCTLIPGVVSCPPPLSFFFSLLFLKLRQQVFQHFYSILFFCSSCLVICQNEGLHDVVFRAVITTPSPTQTMVASFGLIIRCDDTVRMHVFVVATIIKFYMICPHVIKCEKLSIYSD